MSYYARTPRGVLWLLLLLTVSTITPIGIFNGLLFFQILLCIFIFLSIFIKFEMKIDDGYLTYQVFLFALPIYKKVLYPNQIIQLKFKRTGWNTKSIIIQVKKGFNIRIVNFSPATLFIDLIDFANKNRIAISKTKDYLILEK